MPHKTLYVAKKETGLWAAAERVATQRDTSVSRIVAEALDKHLPQFADAPALPTDPWAHIAAEAA